MTLDTHAAPTRSAERAAPLSPAQQAALLPERLARTTAANVYVALEFPASLSDGVAERATAALSAHEILRTVYPDDRRVPYQRVAEAPEVAVDTVEAAEATLPAALMSDAGHRFDLATDLPIRIRLYRLPDRAILSIAIHPVAADDHTVDLLAAELFGVTLGPATTTLSAAGSLSQYRDFASVLTKQLAAEDDSLSFWKQRLEGLAEQLLPLRERPQTPRSARAVVRISATSLAAVVAGEQQSTSSGRSQSGATAVLTALVADTLRELGAPSDVPLGLATPGRPADASRVLGNFANYTVLRVDSPRGGTPWDLIGATRGLLEEAYAHEGTRIERLTHQLRGPGGAAKGGLFQVLVGVRAAVLELDVPGGVVREIARAAARPHGVDLIVDAVTTVDGWTVTVDLTEELSRRYSVEQFARRLRETAESWSAAPDVALGTDIPVQPCDWFADDDELSLDLAISGLGGAPRTPAEQLIADALREILELDDEDEVGREDNFFALGGDSVAALRFVTVLADRGHVLDVQQVFEFPTVYEMAANLSSDAPAPQADPPAEVAPLAASGLDAAALAALAGKLAGR
ncbi:condensation domain-containing protein [Nocardia sp. NBC_00511]|uniref:condensation domain-containing protein n=1 Tax=Nocardia sp. NBC_00511 TaxID=2903591 RepID=UPI0030E07FEC